MYLARNEISKTRNKIWKYQVRGKLSPDLETELIRREQSRPFSPRCRSKRISLMASMT